MSEQRSKSAFLEQIKYNRTAWLNIFVFTAAAFFFRWSITDLLWGTWVMFSMVLLLTVLAKAFHSPPKIKSIGGSLAAYILGPFILLWIILCPAFIIQNPTGEAFSISSFASYLLKTHWVVMIVAVINVLYGIIREYKQKEHPIIQFVPLFLVALAMLLLAKYIKEPGIVVYFILFFLLFMPLRDSGKEKEMTAYDNYWNKKEKTDNQK